LIPGEPGTSDARKLGSTQKLIGTSLKRLPPCKFGVIRATEKIMRRTDYKIRVSSPSFTIPDVGSHLLTCLLPCDLGIRFHMENTFLLDNYGIP